MSPSPNNPLAAVGPDVVRNADVGQDGILRRVANPPLPPVHRPLLSRLRPSLARQCRFAILPFVLLLLLLSLLAAQQPPLIRVQVNLVRILATVKTDTGALVGSLTKDDFEVFDNGVRQEIAHFERQTEQPLSVALLVDVSGSTAKDLAYEIDSAAKFLHALLSEGNPEDRISLFSFDDTVRQEHNFSHNALSLGAALKRLHGTAGTSLYDAICLASRELEPRQGRKVMVIVSDGGETTSKWTSHDALQAAQLADAVIYPIVVVPIANDAGRNRGGENALTYLARGTGGRPFFPAANAQLDRAFRDIVADLRTQYSIGFYPHNVPLTKERWHKLDLRVKTGKLQVSARNGYYGESEGSSERAPDNVDPVNADVRKKR